MKKKKEYSKVEGNGFRDRSIIEVPSEFFFFLSFVILNKMHVSKASVSQWNQTQIIALDSLKAGLFTFFI